MSLFNPRSLRWRLVMKITLAQTMMLALIITAGFVFFSTAWYLGYLNDGFYDRSTPDAVSTAIRREPDGRLRLENTQELATLRAQIPGFWFIVRDEAGQEFREGSVPAEVTAAALAMDAISYADLGRDAPDTGSPIGTIQWIDTQAGSLKIMSSARAPVTFAQTLATSQIPVTLMMILTVTMGLATLLVTPFVVRRAMAGLDRAADETKRIDIQRIGTRLTTESVPLEVLPFVDAVNGALSRLDKGYESHKRFLTDAAHELRTPIAILATRLAALPSGDVKARLVEDTARLTALTGQLLDLQRLEQQQVTLTELDLVKLAERVVLDLAPLAFNAGYEMEFEHEADRVTIRADQMAVERALTNLIQNAINYGGRRGMITIHVAASGFVDVRDDGKGIPEESRERIFEPFHRLKQDGRGVGLGLDLVQKIMLLHGGRVELVQQEQGACFRLVFPPVENTPSGHR